MSLVDDVAELGEQVLDAGVGLAKQAMEEAEDLANRASDVAQAIYHGLNEVSDAFEDAMDWMGDTLEQAGKDFIDWLDQHVHTVVKAIQDLQSGLENIVKGVDELLYRILSWANNIKEYFTEALAAVVDWVHDALPDPVQWILDEAIPFVWAGVKLLAALALFYAMWPTALAAVLICQQIATVYGKEYGNVLEQILKGNPRYAQMHSIRRLPSVGKYFIFSDFHLYTQGTSNAVAFQETMPLYIAALQHYAIEGFHLIENGDIEDYWLRGGSLYGVIYDLSSALPAPYLDKAYNEAQVLAAAKVHLHAIVDQNKPLYTLIRSAFHDQNRYSRTVGNHDDIYSHPKMVEALRSFYPGIQVHDYIVFENDGKGIGVIAHGHQTDAWDMEGCSFLGKPVTSLGSAVRDISLGEWKPGVTDEEKTNSIWNFEKNPNIMDELNPWLGITAQLGNLDEVRLYRAMKKKGLTGPEAWMPFILLGHTHTPLAAPIAPHSEGRWWRYANSGCGMFKRMITGLEWDGTANANLPKVRLVAWRYRDDIQEAGGGFKQKVLAEPA
jgi:hypothetical protein